MRYHVDAETASGPGEWLSPGPGIAMRLFFGDPEGACVALLRFDPGAVMPMHIHAGDEHVLVLEGKAADDNGECVRGDYLFNPEGSARKVRSKEGCLLLVHRLGPLRFPAEGEIAGQGSEQFRIRTGMKGPEVGNPAWRKLRPGVYFRTLYRGGPGDYQAALLHYLPGAFITRHEHVGREHIFILQGAQSDEHGSYGPGTYVHNPVGTSHDVRSDGGCLAYAHWHAPVRFADAAASAEGAGT